VLVLVAVAAAGVVGSAAGAQLPGFSDVPDDHPQAHDISHAADQGWFQGYEDGMFRPDNELTDWQAVTVFGRAFPDGVTRADLATILRAGANQLATISDDAFWGCVDVVDVHDRLAGVENPKVLQEVCYQRVIQEIRNGRVFVIARIQTLTDCPRGWELVVRLSPGEGLAPSATFGVGYSPAAFAGDVLTVGVESNMDRWETLDVTSDCQHPT